MIITAQRREWIRQHAFIPDRGAPHAVAVAIASVIGDGNILAAWLTWVTGTGMGTTTYTGWVVTGTDLGHVQVEYDREFYDQHAESQHHLTPTSTACWVRPLAGIIGLRWGAFYEDSSKDDTYYPARSITVTFADHEVTIGEDAVPVEQRAAADGLLAAIRKGANI